MSAGWVAAGVRARGLGLRRIGALSARELAASDSLEKALEVLARTPYGHDVRADMDLPSAEHAVLATLLWHTRILAGWGPPLGSGALRLLAAGFEIDNVTGHVARVSGREAPEPFVMGSLSTAWSAVSAASSPAGVRAALAASSWGDPGSEDEATVRLSLLLGWARRVLDGVPGAGDWAISGAALVMCRVISANATSALSPGARRDAGHLLGPRWSETISLGDFVRRAPRPAAKMLEDVEDVDDLWRAEVRWWSSVEAGGAQLAARSALDVSSCVGVVGMLACDAWRARAAIQLAARGGGELAEVLGALA